MGALWKPGTFRLPGVAEEGPEAGLKEAARAIISTESTMPAVYCVSLKSTLEFRLRFQGQERIHSGDVDRDTDYHKFSGRKKVPRLKLLLKQNPSRLLAVGHTQFHENMGEMILHGSFVDVQTRSDISVAQSLGHVGKNL